MWFTCADLQHQFVVRPLWLLSVLLHTWTTESLAPQLSLSPTSLQIRVKRTITRLHDTNIKAMYEVMHPNPRLSRAGTGCAAQICLPSPQLAHDFTGMKLLITWSDGKLPIRAVSPSVPKMPGAYSMWMFNTSVFPFDIHCHFTEWSSQLAPETQPTYLWAPALVSTWVLPHKACIFYSILRHQEYYWYLMTKTR